MDQQNCILLVDNGSYRATSVLSLRRIAKDLSGLSGVKVHPLSLLHSAKIDPDQLGGVPAQTVEPFLKGMLAEGTNKFLVVPLFVGTLLVDPWRP